MHGRSDGGYATTTGPNNPPYQTATGTAIPAGSNPFLFVNEIASTQGPSNAAVRVLPPNTEVDNDRARRAITPAVFSSVT